MTRNTSKAPLKKPRGAIKESAGKVTENDRLVAEGKADKADKAAGAMRQSVGDVKDAGRKVADSLKR